MEEEEGDKCSFIKYFHYLERPRTMKSAIDASLLHTMNLATLIFFNASGLVLIAILRAMLFTTKGWIYRYRGTAMVDKFGVMCKDWTDPEDIGILYYTIACEHFVHLEKFQSVSGQS